MRMTLIHTRGAGSRNCSKESLLGALSGAGYEVAYCSPQEDDLAAFLQDPGGLVAVAGGDGTVDRVARLLAGTGTPLAILPTGTANNVAACLGVDGAPSALIEAWRSADHRRVDLGLMRLDGEDHGFLEAAGTGLFPRMMNLLSNDEAKGQLAGEEELDYDRRSWLAHLETADLRPMEIHLDGEDLSGEYLLVEAMNVRSIGPNLRLAPEAAPADGRLDVVLLGDAEREVLTAYLRGLLSGSPPSVTFPTRRGRALRIRNPDGWFHADDEVLHGGARSMAQIAVRPAALTVLV